MSRENLALMRSLLARPMFQSAPGSMSRENAQPGDDADGASDVSIRSRLDEPGERFRRPWSVAGSMFQSAPGSMSRENRPDLTGTSASREFQSAPGSMSRENRQIQQALAELGCFNPLPAR